MKLLRQPIVTTLGHVDSGKTSILDSIRKTSVASREHGGITQHVGASELPRETIKQVCREFLERNKISLGIRGLLLIDTPGHAVFANLRRRGGSIADIAVLVVDAGKGMEEQTLEGLQILREYKTPFVIAFNKVDALTGWIARPGEGMTESLAAQRSEVLQRLDEKIYSLVGELYKHGFSAERFDRITDFTKQVVIIPLSAKTREGLQELLAFISGLAQKYLEKSLKEDGEGEGRASVLEVREERGLGMTMDAILYEGSVREGDEIVFAAAGGPVKNKVKAIFKPKPLDEMRDPREKFSAVTKVSAASGIKISCEDAGKALPGGSLFVCRSPESARKALEAIAAETKEILFETQKEGVMLFADALGSLEAITKLLSAAGIPVRSAAVGAPLKKNVLEAGSVGEKNRFLGVLLCFNSTPDDEVKKIAEEQNVKIFDEKIIYNLTEGYQKWVEEEKSAERREAFSSLVLPAKLRVLKDHCFRVSKPCIVGVEVLAGTLKTGVCLLNQDGEKIGEVKGIQEAKNSLAEARKGKQVAVSIDGPTFGRQVKDSMIFWVELPKESFRVLETKYRSALSEEELELLAETKQMISFRSQSKA